MARVLRSHVIQPKLTVSHPDDEYEREADRVADQVMRMPEPQSGLAVQRSQLKIQRLCSTCEEQMPQRQSIADEEKEDLIRAKSVDTSANRHVTPGLETYLNTSRGGGRPLPPSARAYFEPRFGHDFSHVRLHTDSRAADAARQLNAHAFTAGADVHFAHGQYDPGTTWGRRLLFHELTHVVQQSAESEPRRLQRWAITGNEAVSNHQSDTLWALAKRITGNGRNWPCIRPVSMLSSRATGSAYPRFIRLGDRFDISNLTATEGVALRVHLFDPVSEWRDAGIASFFYPGTISSGGDVDLDISNAAGDGITPIREFLVFGHAGGNRMWGGAVTSFQPSSNRPEDPPPTREQAEAGLLPRRCWFTRNATARAVGCDSAVFGTDFAAAYLRAGANITSTTRSVRPRCQGLAFTIGAALGIPGGCAWYNGLDFATGSTIGATTVAGPFWSVGDFHSAPLWTTTSGRL